MCYTDFTTQNCIIFYKVHNLGIVYLFSLCRKGFVW